MSLLHHRLDERANSFPDRVVVEDEHTRLTLRQLRNSAASLATWLSQNGISKGDRVIIVARNNVMTASLIYATATVGACFVPIHPDTAPDQISYIQANSGAVMVISFVDGWVANVGGEVSALPSFEVLLNGGPIERTLMAYQPSTISEDPACLIYTSGSTGRPKGVTCLHRQMVFAVEAITAALDYREDDRIFCALPLSFDYGLYQLFLAIEAGCTLSLASPEISGLGLFRALKERRANIFPAVPALIEALAILGHRQPGRLPDLRLVTNTGAAPSPAAIKRLREAFPSVGFQLMYGLTECKRVSISPVDKDLEKPGTCGLPLKGTAISIVDEAGAPIANGEIGQIVIRGPHVMAGYWSEEALTNAVYRRRQATLVDLYSGDYGWVDDDGYLYCQGRRDDIFKIRGFRVSCSEIEAACCDVPGVVHAVMIPPGPQHRGTLFVCFSEAQFDVAAALRARLEPYKVPDRVLPITEMPKTANNKFDRRALARLLEERVAQQTITVENPYAQERSVQR
ncbi:AMP-dependent synthetase/ligase protein (plasmid) [Rhizobium gallicum]|uniref:AMP-dependent synthetase/ligase protein n=1 Tax=Rhizobium gallicum TaxID=56730 RepID=A0A1L5NPG6_9HYPH|nr:class I adenylate-forming enzyme family protein [Rhizobium gallicum]APO69783.1 AMP-dependent synthetase/ligase protein [Rhizobium gallicum]